MGAGESWWVKDIARVPGTSTLVVALGTEGVLVGDGERWTRVGVGPWTPTPTRAAPLEALAMLAGTQWMFAAAAALLAATLFSVLSWLAPPALRSRTPIEDRVPAVSPRFGFLMGFLAIIAVTFAALVFALFASRSWSRLATPGA